VKRLLAKNPRTLLIAIAIVVGATVGALAYWQGSGSGKATAELADTQPLSIEPGTPTAELFPGGTATVTVVVTNPNPYFVQLGSMVLYAGDAEPFGVDNGHSGCDPSALSFVAQDHGGTGWRIPPKAGMTEGTLAIAMPAAMKMSDAAADACQGATFTVHLEGRS
jgi:hypothetical protein